MPRTRWGFPMPDASKPDCRPTSWFSRVRTGATSCMRWAQIRCARYGYAASGREDETLDASQRDHSMTTLFRPDLLYTDGAFDSNAGLFAGEDGRILAMTGEASRADAMVDLRGKAMLPGFVNA